MIALEFLLLVWDGFLIIGRRLGVRETKLRQFADTCFMATAAMCILQFALCMMALKVGLG